MIIETRILDGPLPAAQPSALCPGAGALLVFEGLVRELEAERQITALNYLTYEPMAQMQLESLAADTACRHGLLGIQALHSRGRIPVGACSFRLTIAARHRKEALAAMDEFIDRLKRDVPIWKSPVFL